MFKRLLSLLLIASPLLAVHDFFAERNFICELCTHLSTQATVSEIEHTFKSFPMLQRHMPESVADIQVSNYCQKKGLCSFVLLDSEKPNHQELVSTVNAKKSTWTAEVSPRFQGMTTEEIKSMMGTIVDPSFTTPSAPKLDSPLTADLPATFDAREGFPFCKDTIGHIRD